MVESTSETGLLDSKLAVEWTKLAKAQEATNTFITQSVKREIPGGEPDLGMVAFFNLKLVMIDLCSQIHRTLTD